MDTTQRLEMENKIKQRGDGVLTDFLHENGFLLNRIETLREDYALFAGLGEQNRRRLGLVGDELLIVCLHHKKQLNWFLVEARTLLARHGRLTKTAVLVVSDDPSIAGLCAGAYRDIKSGYKSAFIGITWEQLRRPLAGGHRQILDEQFELQAFSVDHFDTRTPVPDDMFGRESLVAQLEHEASSAQFGTALLGVRRVGKTSVLKGALENLRARRDERWVIALYDAQSDTVDATSEKAIASLLATLRQEVRRLGLDINSTSEDKRKAIRWMVEKLSAANVRVALAIDEIEWLVPTAIDVGSARTERERDYVRLFGYLRALKQDFGEAISLVVCGINETFCEVPEYGELPNPALDLFRRQYVGMLDERTTGEMVRTLAARMGIQVESGFLGRLWSEFGGHPYLSRQFCSELLRVTSPRPRWLDVRLFDNEYDRFLALRADIVLGSVMTSLARFYPNEYEVLRQLVSNLSNQGLRPVTGTHLSAYGLVTDDGEFRLGALKRYVSSRTSARVASARFTRLTRLGAGVTGTVWKCVDVNGGGRFCAVKVYTGDDAEDVAKFEWIALQTVKSRYVPEPYEQVEVDGQPAISMELVDGSSLSTVISTERLTLVDFQKLTLELLAGIESIHPSEQRKSELRTLLNSKSNVTEEDYREYLGALESGLLHRDVKPANIVVRRLPEGWMVKYVDLQLAKSINDVRLTRVGTPAYAPPDWGTARWDASFDLYSLGVVFFELLFGVLPDSNDFEKSIGRFAVSSRSSSLLVNFFSRALAPSASDRFARADEMRAVWEEVLTDPVFPNEPFPMRQVV